MTRRIVRILFLALLWLGGALAGDATSAPKSPLMLDPGPSGDLLLYNPETGIWFNARYNASAPDGFSYLSGTWPIGLTVIPARLNDDDLTDAILYNPATGAYSWAIHNGTGYTLTDGTFAAGLRIETGDFNGDRLHDLLLYDPVTGSWTVALNSGATTFTLQTGTWAPGLDIFTPDFDGDGQSDVFTYDPQSGAWQHLLSNATGTGFKATKTGTWSPGWQIFIVKLNQDARDDLFLYLPGFGIWFQCLSIDGAEPFSYYSEVWSPGWTIHPGDLNGDGITDIFLYNPVTGMWFRCVAKSGGTGFASYTFGFWSPGWGISITDLNGDGRADVFLYDLANGIYFQCLTPVSGEFTYLRAFWSPGWRIQSEVSGLKALVVAPPPPPPPPPPPTTPFLTTTKILAFGDSITTGTDPRYQRTHVQYPAELAALLAAKYPNQTISVTNMGSPGEWAIDGKGRFPGVVDSLNPDLVLILEGINDINGGAAPFNITAALESMVRYAQGKGIKVLLARLTPVSAAWDQAAVNTVNARINDVATVTGISPAVDLFGALNSNFGLYIGSDGLHPTAEGYRKMADTFFNAIVTRFQILK